MCVGVCVCVNVCVGVCVWCVCACVCWCVCVWVGVGGFVHSCFLILCTILPVVTDFSLGVTYSWCYVLPDNAYYVLSGWLFFGQEI